MEFKSNEDFAEKYRAFLIEMADTEANMYNMSRREIIDDIPTKNGIISDIVNYRTGDMIDSLLDIKEYYNDRYDNEDPDCAAIIHSCELFINFLKKF